MSIKKSFIKTLLAGLVAIGIVIIVVTVSWNRPPSYDPVYRTTATLDFANTIAGAATDLTVALSGVQLGDAVVIGAPDGSMLTNGSYYGWVSASNVVSVRFLNGNLLTALNPSTGSFKIAVIPVR